MNQLAYQLVQESVATDGEGEPSQPTKSEISRVMAELGRRGGAIDGKKRAESLTAQKA